MGVRIIFHPSARGGKSLRKQLGSHHLVIQGILRQLVVVQHHRNLFFLHAIHTHPPHTLHRAQPVLQVVHILLEFPISLILTLHGDKQCRRIAKIIQDLQGKHIGWQLRLERGDAMLELTPELILIIHLIVQLHLNIHYPIPVGRESFLLLYLLVAENVILQRLRHPLHHLLRGIAGCHCHHHSLTHRKIRELILSHLGKAVYSQCHQTAYHQNDNLAIMHCPFYRISFFPTHFSITY